MYYIRPVKFTDIDDLYQLALKMAPGITTFPPQKQVIESKIQRSISSFKRVNDDNKARELLLVLVDKKLDTVIGIAGVYSDIGHDAPFYSFKRIKQSKQSILPDTDQKVSVTSTALHLTNAFQGGTEVGTLLLDPDYNGLGLGKFLAKSRYLLIASFIELFAEPVFAELRGWTKEGDISPFWEAVGKHFFANIDFSRADVLSGTTDKRFIAELMPDHPIYENLLNKEVQAVIGQAHRKGKAALDMLLKEGFRDEGYVDIFDAGATVTARFNDLHTISNSTLLGLDTKEKLNKQHKTAFIAVTDLTNFHVYRTDHYQHDDQNKVIYLEKSLFDKLNNISKHPVRVYFN